MKARICIPALFLIVFSSCKYYNESDFSSVKKYDTHIHLRTTSDAVSKIAKADNFQLINVNVAVADSPLKEQRVFTKFQVVSHPGQIQFIDAFSMKNWDSASWVTETIKQLKEAFANGALGIKIWKNIGMVERDSSGKLIMIDNPRFDSVIQFVIDQHKTVLGHLGEPKNCWLPLEKMTVNNDRSYFKEWPQYHMYLHPEMPSYEDQIAARDRFLARHPDMSFVGAHLGSLEYDVDSLAKRLDQFPNMAVDVAARMCHLQFQSQANLEKVRNFLIKYQDRIIYGSDLVLSDSRKPEDAADWLHKRWVEDWKYFTTDKPMTVSDVNGEFKGLKLPRTVIDKIYYTNAVKWFGIRD